MVPAFQEHGDWYVKDRVKEPAEVKVACIVNWGVWVRRHFFYLSF